MMLTAQGRWGQAFGSVTAFILLLRFFFSIVPGNITFNIIREKIVHIHLKK